MDPILIIGGLGLLALLLSGKGKDSSQSDVTVGEGTRTDGRGNPVPEPPRPPPRPGGQEPAILSQIRGADLLDTIVTLTPDNGDRAVAAFDIISTRSTRIAPGDYILVGFSLPESVEVIDDLESDTVLRVAVSNVTGIKPA